MPFPHWLARANVLVTNRFMRIGAAWLPWMGVLEHVGRKSGTVRRTAIMVYPRDRGRRYVIALVYGSRVEWLKNLDAAGGGRVRIMGRWRRFGAPRRFGDTRRRDVPWLMRPFLAVLRVSDFVDLPAVDAQR
jgi:deazaflavin-dependent oxidoreductase (nitroreductase family)